MGGIFLSSNVLRGDGSLLIQLQVGRPFHTYASEIRKACIHFEMNSSAGAQCSSQACLGPVW